MPGSLATVTRNPTLAPEYAHHRYANAPDSGGPYIDKKLGMNMASYSHAHIQVVPSGGGNPNVAVLWWSEAQGRFVQEHTPITKAGVGADTAYEFTVECRGRIMFVEIPTLAAGVAEVYVAGYNVERV